MTSTDQVKLGGAERSSTARLVDVSLLAVAVVWGSSYLAAKTVVTHETVPGFLSLRFVIAAIFLSLPLVPRLRRIRATELRLGVVYGGILSAIFVLETAGVVGTSASNAGLIISLTMLMTPWLEGRITGRPMTTRFYRAALLALVGVAMLTQANGFAVPGWGDGLILLAAIMRAIHVAVIDRTTVERKVDSASITLVQLVVVAGAMTSAAFLLGPSPITVARSYDCLDWLLLVYLALACTVFAFFVQMWAVRRTSPSRVSLLLGTEPVWAAAFGTSLAGDPMTLPVVIGAMCVLAGTALGRQALGGTSLDPDAPPKTPGANSCDQPRPG